MRPFLSKSLKVAGLRGSSIKKQQLKKVTKMLPALAISPEAAIRKPKWHSPKKIHALKPTFSKKSPQIVKKLEEVTLELPQRKVESIEMEPKPRPFVFHPAARKSQKPKQTVDILKKHVKQVIGSKTEKKTYRPVSRMSMINKRQQLITKLEQDSKLYELAIPTLEMKTDSIIVLCASVTTSPEFSPSTHTSTSPEPSTMPATPEAALDPFGTPSIYRANNLRGPDSKFAIPHFNPSLSLPVYYDDLAAQVAAEQAHEEMVKELAYNQSFIDGQSILPQLVQTSCASPTISDHEMALIPDMTPQQAEDVDVDMMEGIEYVGIATQIAYQPMHVCTTAELEAGTELTHQPVNIYTLPGAQFNRQDEPVITSSQAVQLYETNMSDAPINPVVPAWALVPTQEPVSSQPGDTDMVDTAVKPVIRHAGIPASPKTGFEKYQVKTMSPLNPAYGQQHQAETGPSQIGSSSVVAPSQPVDVNSSFSISAMPPPNSARGCQPKKDANQATVLHTIPEANSSRRLDIAAMPLANSPKGCQPKAELESSNTTTKNSLAPPAGARKAVPINLVIGKSMQNSSENPIDTLGSQPQTENNFTDAAPALHSDITESQAAQFNTPLPPSPPSPLTSPDHSPIVTPSPAPSSTRVNANPLKIKLPVNAEKVGNEENIHIYPSRPSPVAWQPKTWNRDVEDVKKCGTWRTLATQIPLSFEQDETLAPGEGEYDQDLERVKVLLSNLDPHGKKTKAITKIMTAVVEGCMGRDNVNLPVGKVIHVGSIPKLAGAMPGSTVELFNPESGVKLTQDKLDDFEDDMINLLLKSPRVWERLIGFVLQRGCTLKQLLVTEDVTEKNGEEFVEYDAEIYDEIFGRQKEWSINWRRVDDLALLVKHQIDVRKHNYYEATDLAGMNRQDFNILLRMIESEGYFEPFADQVKQWAICHRRFFIKIVRKAGWCEESELENLVAVKKWLWTTIGTEHREFHWNIESCLAFRYRHWYERYEEEDELDSESLSM